MNRREFLTRLDLPVEDVLVPSTRRFPDGGQYRIEIPSCEGPVVFREVLAAADEHRVTIHRVSQGSGAMLLLKDEILDMARMGRDRGIEVSLFIGPRAAWDTGGQAASTNGRVVGSHQRGVEQLVAAVEDVRYACDLGIRSVLVGDLGLVAVLTAMKAAGELPPNLVLKSSVTLPVGNPALARLCEQQGVTTVNLITDLTPAQISAIRQAITAPIDLYIEVPDDFGGFLRYYEMPALLRAAAPLYFKFGLRNAAGIYPCGAHLANAAALMGRERVRRARIGLDLLHRYVPDAVMSPLGSSDLGIPET
jgi:hypothetical protein